MKKSNHPVQARHQDGDEALLRQLDTLLATENSDASFTIEQLAQELFLTRGHVNRRVKAATGLTLQQYATRRRLARAASLLAGQPAMSVADVAAHCGFDDPSSFARAFKRVYGTTPSHYRFSHLK